MLPVVSGWSMSCMVPSVVDWGIVVPVVFGMVFDGFDVDWAKAGEAAIARAATPESIRVRMGEVSFVL